MQWIHELIPDPRQLLELEPEELAGFVLEFLNTREKDGTVNLRVYTDEAAVHGYPAEHQGDIRMALMEAWAWLEGEGLLVQAPWVEGPRDWFFISRRGRRMRKAADLAAHRRQRQLPKYLLHPAINQKVWPAFLRGEYDTAIFLAFRQVEVAVRAAGGYPDTLVGTDLMRKAFDKANGPLADQSLPDPEREAMAHLFAGAIGLYKNPQSHRIVAITDPAEAMDIVILASHLLRIADQRSPSPAP